MLSKPTSLNFSGIKIEKIEQINSEWKIEDYLGSLKARFAINRNDYCIDPGLYKIGKPSKDSHVFVTANYKLSFDVLRRDLEDIDAYILVLDTKGINVWCAAGKGTFGTDELIERINRHKIKDLTNNKFVIAPQLGAVGISAHKVKKQTGIGVKYGPVRSADIKEYIEKNLKVSQTMRTVYFPFIERLKLIPVEFVTGFKYFLYAMAFISLIPLFSLISHDFSIDRIIRYAGLSLFGYTVGVLIGPLLLPYLPGRTFSLKGTISGIIAFVLAYAIGWMGNSWIEQCGWILFYFSVSSFMVMNFTGASTYTSLSGVKKEMKRWVPIQVIGLILSIILLSIYQF